MTTIYLSSTLKKDWNLKFNQQMTKALENKGFKVYLPQRDTNQQANLDTIFSQDLKGITDCQLFLAINKNASENLWAELGWAHGQDKKIIILAEEDESVPVFPAKMAKQILRVKSLDNLEKYLDRLILLLKSDRKS